ncbi:MAG: esterase-like activity of phytase family protein [Alphaproteobacteria bacterium]|nr:esterase-like activity of phytase family protein [Alphaproteobacteria bacterium]
MALRPALAALMVLSAAGCGADAPEAPQVRAEPVALFPDDTGRRGVGALRYAGGLALASDSPLFGGWSAMEVSEDGTRLLAISDSAAWMTARLVYDEAGDLTGLADIVITPMLDTDGAPLSGERADAEGLAPLGGGRYAVSFERDHRIAVYEIGENWSQVETATPSSFPGLPGADRLRANAGAEALARLGDQLFAGIEDPIVDGQPNTLWRYDLSRLDTPPRSAAVTLTPGFGLTGLTADGEGGLLVVERFWARDVGNRIVLGRLSAEALSEPERILAPEPLAQLEPDMTVDNFEAVALAQINGDRRILILSDDNFNDAQRTLLLSFAWPD